MAFTVHFWANSQHQQQQQQTPIPTSGTSPWPPTGTPDANAAINENYNTELDHRIPHGTPLVETEPVRTNTPPPPPGNASVRSRAALDTAQEGTTPSGEAADEEDQWVLERPFEVREEDFGDEENDDETVGDDEDEGYYDKDDHDDDENEEPYGESEDLYDDENYYDEQEQEHDEDEHYHEHEHRHEHEHYHDRHENHRDDIQHIRNMIQDIRNMQQQLQNEMHEMGIHFDNRIHEMLRHQTPEERSTRTINPTTTTTASTTVSHSNSSRAVYPNRRLNPSPASSSTLRAPSSFTVRSASSNRTAYPHPRRNPSPASSSTLRPSPTPELSPEPYPGPYPESYPESARNEHERQPSPFLNSFTSGPSLLSHPADTRAAPTRSPFHGIAQALRVSANALERVHGEAGQRVEFEHEENIRETTEIEVPWNATRNVDDVGEEEMEWGGRTRRRQRSESSDRSRSAERGRRRRRVGSRNGREQWLAVVLNIGDQ